MSDPSQRQENIIIGLKATVEHLERQLADCEKDRQAAIADVRRLGAALNHPNTAFSESSSAMMDRWIAEVGAQQRRIEELAGEVERLEEKSERLQIQLAWADGCVDSADAVRALGMECSPYADPLLVMTAACAYAIGQGRALVRRKGRQG